MSSTTPPSQETDVRQLLARANDLERRIAETASSSKSESTSTARLRMQLCETLSDILLTDAPFSNRKDVYGRLWRHCFYQRIQALRARIARHQKRQADSKSITTLQENLNTFLQEAVVLYDYLRDKYERKLVPSLSLQEEDDDDDSATTTAVDGVVAGLSKLYIYLGDLERYRQKYGKSEQYYHKAAKLAPGKGNPYNQLAVVAQLKDSTLTAVSLYYYARALLATHEPFETSWGNLMRLLQTNRDYLSKPNYAAAASQSHSSRQCLAHFCDLHYDLIQIIKDDDDDDDKSNTAEESQKEAIATKMAKVVTMVETLLSDSALGDALLVKMATINAFSVAILQKNKQKSFQQLAQLWVYKFANGLAHRVAQNLSKYTTMNDANTDNHKIPSVRVLLPLLLVCDYVACWEEVPCEDDADYMEAQRQFWSGVVQVANALVQLKSRIFQASQSGPTTLKEYERLRGFAPFQPFLWHSDDVYLTPQEGIRVLGLNLTQDSTATSTRINVSGDENPVKVERFFAVLDRLAEREHGPLARNAESGTYRSTLEKEEGTDEIMVEDDDEEDAFVEFAPDSPPETQLDHKDPPATTKEDVLTYKPSAGGQGPALLVPGAFLLQKVQNSAPASTEVTPPPKDIAVASGARDGSVKLAVKGSVPLQEEEQATDSDRMQVDTPVGVEAAKVPTVIGPPPGIMPPPGFGGPSQPYGLSVNPSQPTPLPPGFSGLTPLQQPTPLQYPLQQPIPPPQQQQQQPETVLGMLGVSQMAAATNNPFVGTSSFPYNSNTNASMQGGLFGYGSGMGNGASFLESDGSALLDSSLLNSLLMDDKSAGKPVSQNPFLT